jgi:antitoxin (DNA-binding transcriptional repressor) of toxin-antitoxin stability system
MAAISISEIQRDLLGYLSRVEAGEILVITDQNRPIAELKPVAIDKGRNATVVEYLSSRIRDAKLPRRWAEDGIAEPSDDCRQTAFAAAERLFIERELIPTRVVASRQAGIYLEYKSPQGGRLLGIEIDNERDVVAVVSDANQVLASAAFEGAEAQELLRVFFGGSATSAGDPRATNTQ